MEPIHTKRLILRDLTPSDFAAFFDASQDPELMKFYPEYETTPEFIKSLFERLLTGTQQVDRLKYQLAICLASGQFLGTCGVRIEDIQHQQASYGCSIGRASWGKGYGYEASRAIIDFGFRTLPIHRIYAETNAENMRARKLAERLGMRLEGELHQHKYFRGRWWNTVIYAVLK